jgi:site-specific recombinase XerD
LRRLERRGLIHDNPMGRLMREYPARGLQGIVHALGTASPDRALRELRRRRAFCSSLADEFRGYLELKRATGRVYAYEESMLLSLDRFLQDGAGGLDAETFDACIKSLARLHSATRSHYYHQGRQFCEYLRRSRPEAFVPAAEFHPLPTPAKTPNVLDREDVYRLFAAAAALPESRRAPLRRRSFQTMLSLLYCCGLRLGEALRLDIGDVDLSQGVLTVRNTKFFKSRLVPMDASVMSRVADYLESRKDAGYPASADAPLFCSSRNRRYFKTTVRHTIYRLMESVGIRTARRRVRIHDLRHTFAVHRLSQWYRDGEDVQARLPILSQYLGHVDIAYTQKYLKLVPELCGAAMDRFQQYAVPLRRTHDEER